MASIRYSLITLVLLALLSTACGRETKVYPGTPTPDPTPQPTPATQSNPPVTTQPSPGALPKGFLDQSVNGGEVDLALDGSGSTLALRLVTQPQTNSDGGFNGTGSGNRALLGLALASGRKLSDLSSTAFDANVYAGTLSIRVLWQVDLDCSGSQAPRLLIASQPVSSSGAANGYQRFNAGVSDAIWQVSGAAITDPSAPATTLVPSDSGTTHSDLSALLAKYPSACLKNGATSAPDLPKNLPTAALIFALGAVDTTTLNGAFIDRIAVGADVFDSTTWGSAQ